MTISKKRAEAARVVAKMYKICQIDGFGEIDGVEFDFRSERLPPNEWQTIPLRAHLDQFRTPGQPFLWFPWFGPFDAARLREDAEVDLSKSGGKPSKADIEGYVVDRTPDVIV